MKAEDRSQKGRLSRPVRSDEAAELPGLQFEIDPVEYAAARERNVHALDRKRFAPSPHRSYFPEAWSFSVETLLAIASFKALSSASIQDW